VYAGLWGRIVDSEKSKKENQPQIKDKQKVKDGPTQVYRNRDAGCSGTATQLPQPLQFRGPIIPYKNKIDANVESRIVLHRSLVITVAPVFG